MTMNPRLLRRRRRRMTPRHAPGRPGPPPGAARSPASPIRRAGRSRAPTCLALIERLGFVQLDSIQTVARAHQMILFARNERYRPELLRRLLEDEALLFEHWTDRIAALIPTRFYPYWTWRFRREAARLEERFTRWFGPGYRAEIDRLLARIRDQGPLHGARPRPARQPAGRRLVGVARRQGRARVSSGAAAGSRSPAARASRRCTICPSG